VAANTKGDPMKRSMTRPMKLPMKPSLQLSKFAFLFSVLALHAGCGEQADPSYQGEPLAVLKGTLTSDQTSLPAADLVLGWPDYTKTVADATPFATFVRVEVAATLPARFSAEIFQPPPETAYFVPPTDGDRLVGPRFATAIIMLAKRGATVVDTSVNLVNRADGPVLATFPEYMLTYYESDGDLGIQPADGSPVVKVGHVTKGFELVHNVTTECSNGIDQACLDRAREFGGGMISDFDRHFCSMVSSETKATTVPFDSMDLNVPAVDAPLPVLQPCHSTNG
jgi:hypothetical protein